MKNDLSRRGMLKGLTAGAAVAMGFGGAEALGQEAAANPLKGNLKFGVTRGFGRRMDTDEFLSAVRELGIQSIDLAGPDLWPKINEHGLVCSMGGGAGFGLSRGFNQPELHDELVRQYSELIPQAAEAGVPNLICFSGNRNGLDDKTGLENCAKGLARVMPVAEEHGVNMCMELLNSKVNHPGYQCDHSVWGVELCKAVGSPRMTLLYDIYHMQIMEGDLIRNIKAYIDYITGFHVAGNPGRHEPDLTQEIYYPAVMRAIAETDYDGYVVFEYGPTIQDRLESLRQSLAICDV